MHSLRRWRWRRRILLLLARTPRNLDHVLHRRSRVRPARVHLCLHNAGMVAGSPQTRSATDKARCCLCELLPASMTARPVCSYAHGFATRFRRSLSSSSSAAHVGSFLPYLAPTAAGPPARSRVCAPPQCGLRARLPPVAAAMFSVAATRTRSRSTSMDSSVSPSATWTGLRPQHHDVVAGNAFQAPCQSVFIGSATSMVKKGIDSFP